MTPVIPNTAKQVSHTANSSDSEELAPKKKILSKMPNSTPTSS
jgi:hypothetical protein